jgi:Glycosyl hydrolase family 20, catalytic domain
MKKHEAIEPDKHLCITSGNPGLSNFLCDFARRLRNEADIETQCLSADLPENTVVVDLQRTSFQNPVKLSNEISTCSAQLGPEDAFIIHRVNDAQALIVSHSFSGILDGLVECYHQIKACVVHRQTVVLKDVCGIPAVKNRFTHICMSGSTPDIKTLLEYVKTIKFLKYNGFVIEFENKFPYKKHQDFLHPEHYSEADIKALRKTALDFGIKIIPLVQGLGHLEYLLKYGRYKHLREADPGISSACPLNQETFELFSACTEEILESFPETEYFHIGADEVREIGKCPACKQYAENHGKYAPFTDYITKVTDYLISKNIRPMMWDDIIYRHYPFVKIEKLSKQVIMVNWDYYTTDQRVPHFLYTLEGARYGITMSKKHFIIDEYPSQYRGDISVNYPAGEIFEEHDWADTKIEEFITNDDFPYLMQGFPVIEMIKKDGFTPAGASAIRKSLNGTSSQNFMQRIYNNRAWGEKLKNANVDYFIATAWARGNSLKNPVFNMELMLYTLASGAYFAWHGGGEISDFNAYFMNHVYSGKDNPTLNMTPVEMLNGMSIIKSPAFYEYLARNTAALEKSKVPFYQMLSLYIKVFILKKEYENAKNRMTGFLYRMEMEKDYPLYVKEECLATLKNFISRFDSIKKQSLKILNKYLLPLDAVELTTSLFNYENEATIYIIKKIQKTINRE